MPNLSTHHVVSPTKMWNRRRWEFSTQECQTSYNLSNNKIQPQSYQIIDNNASLSSGELSSSSFKNKKKKRKEERRKKKRERRKIKEESRKKREERRRNKRNTIDAEDCINLPTSKWIKRTNAFERDDGSKSKHTATWVGSKATKTTSTVEKWTSVSNLHSKNNEITSYTSSLYEAISSDEDSLLDFTPNPSEADLIFSSDGLPESVKQLPREDLEIVAIKHIALCKKYAQNEQELDFCKGREENFHSIILQLNQEVIKLRSMIPPSKTTRSIGVQMQSNSSSGQQNSFVPLQIKVERVEDSKHEEITSSGNRSNYLLTPPSTLNNSAVLTSAFPVGKKENHT